MQLDQTGNTSQATVPFARIPRSRPGTRGAMRITNRYTMPPLVPRTQRSSLMWDTQSQSLAVSPYLMEALEPLPSGDEDAWLNDVQLPSHLNNQVGEMMAADRASVDRSAKDETILPGHRLWSVVCRLSERVCQELARRQTAVEGEHSELEEMARKCVVDMLRVEPTLADQIYNLTEAEQVIQNVIDEALGAGPLAALLRDESVTEILAVGPRLTTIERDGDMQDAPHHFEDEQHMTRIVGNILRGAGRVFDPSMAITNARLHDGTFVNVVMPPSAVKGPTITLRKRRKSVPTLTQLVARGTMSQAMADFLQMCVRARQNIVICGGLRAGRTTLLNALAACIPGAERIVTLEDVAELQLPQKQVVSLEARLTGPDSGGREHERMRDLLLCALRMRPQRLIMGDCWNDEAGVWLSALHAGYDGSLFNIYANGLQDCLSRLEMMWLASRPGASIATVREQVARTVHIVIYLARMADGSRKVVNIAEVTGTQRDRIKARSIFHYQESGDGQGRFEPGYGISSRLNSSR